MFKHLSEKIVESSHKRILNRVLCKPEELIAVPYFDCRVVDISIEQGNDPSGELCSGLSGELCSGPSGELIFSMIPNIVTSLSYLIENSHNIRVKMGVILPHEKISEEEIRLLREEFSHKIFRFSTVQLLEEETPLFFKNPIIFDKRDATTNSYIVVLGCSKEDVMAKRVEKAIDVFNNNPWNNKTYMIFSGGCPKVRSTGFMTESMNMKDYAIFRGMPPDRLLLEELSSNTIENLLFTYKIIEARSNSQHLPQITIVTSQYHIKRTEILSLIVLRKLTIQYIGTNEVPTPEEIEREHGLLCRYLKSR